MIVQSVFVELPSVKYTSVHRGAGFENIRARRRVPPHKRDHVDVVCRHFTLGGSCVLNFQGKAFVHFFRNSPEYIAGHFTIVSKPVSKLKQMFQIFDLCVILRIHLICSTVWSLTSCRTLVNSQTFCFLAMAEGNGEVSMEEKSNVKQESQDVKVERTEDYAKLVEYGLDEKVAGKLDEIYKTGKLAHADLDERALDALKEFPVEGALNVLTQFLDSNLEHVSNKSAYLCGVMKTYRQKSRAGQGSGSGTVAKAPDEDKIKSILERTGYTLDVTTGQRKYGGPPPGWEGATPGNGCEVFCGKIPKDMYEDELIPLFEKCGSIWDLRLMMDPMTGLNRGYAFITFTTRDAAQLAVRELDNHEIKPGKSLKVNISVPNLRLFVGNIPKSKGKEEILDEFGKLTANQLNDYEIRKGKKIGVTVSYNNHRLFVGNIPKNRDRDELFEEFSKHAPGLTEVIIYSSPDDKKKNRGFCFLEYESHKAASLAKRRLGTGRIKVWGCDIIVDWADPQEEPDEATMSKVKVLYVRNLTQDCSEEKLKESFEAFGKVERVKKIKDYAFIHFEDRDNAMTVCISIIEFLLVSIVDVTLFLKTNKLMSIKALYFIPRK
ncbi:hypothetical protein ANN_16346 [Periplaneta americana]|uniref:RRM domain-containing protein n=1 Tax=Periplaneta americana TaxID=6978 RepID=A0ABQ8SJY0_PERAM|nr:hypothetical protein ANN_16346 [Periplaneta americana]